MHPLRRGAIFEYDPPAEKILLTDPDYSTLARLAASAVLRPQLLVLLLRNAWRFRRRDWHRRPPFLPLPPAEYLGWRLHTAYGEQGRAPALDELERYLRWTLRMSR